ncbi:hypothetical protein [Thalassobacillus devorans]|uniref:hypothetical protein n=1 Tax=Thalassobacillus devorans TaxID=279813 RepID=UPI000A1CF190|nr:hypothetical protein [Thalassobacillus devorans]
MDKKAFMDKLEHFLPNNSKSFLDKMVNIIELGSKMGTQFNDIETTSIRREANVMTAYFFRNSELEEVHASNGTEVLNSNFLDELIYSNSALFQEWLEMREDFKYNNVRIIYDFILQSYELMYTKRWEINPVIFSIPPQGEIEHSFSSQEFKDFWETLTKYKSGNSNAFLANIKDFCIGGAKRLQNSTSIFEYESEVNESRIIMEYCFSLSVPTEWLGKDALTDENMKTLMITSSEKLSEWLTLKDSLILAEEDEVYYELLYLMGVSLDVV